MLHPLKVLSTLRELLRGFTCFTAATSIHQPTFLIVCRSSAMSTFFAAFIATLITTGMSSAVSHDLTILGGSIVTLIFAASTVVRKNANVYPVFLIGAFLMVVIALISSEVNTSEFSSTVHVLSMYVALIGLAFSSPDLSSFCQQLMMGTNLLLTVWIMYQGYYAEPLKAWQISNPSGATNVMAAQLNMTMPLVLSRMNNSTGEKKMAYMALFFFNCVSVVLVMSRNGIGAMLILLTLYLFFNYKRLAVFTISLIMSVSVSLDSIIQIPFVHNILVRMRFVGYAPSAPRSVIWQVAWGHIKTHPTLGVGPGGPKQALEIIDTYHAHNNYIQVALETGIPSGAVFVVMTLLLLWLSAKTMFKGREHFVLTLSILSYVSYSWTAMPLTYSNMTLLLAACVHEARITIQRLNSEEISRRKPRIVGREQSPTQGNHLPRAA
jgi:hypothetical protein